MNLFSTYSTNIYIFLDAVILRCYIWTVSCCHLSPTKEAEPQNYQQDTRKSLYGEDGY